MRPPSNVVILQFCRAILALLTTTRSLGKIYVIQQKMLHNFLKSNNCRKNFDKYTKMLRENGTNFKLVKNGMSEIFFLPALP